MPHNPQSNKCFLALHGSPPAASRPPSELGSGTKKRRGGQCKSQGDLQEKKKRLFKHPINKRGIIGGGDRGATGSTTRLFCPAEWSLSKKGKNVPIEEQARREKISALGTGSHENTAGTSF